MPQNTLRKRYLNAFSLGTETGRFSYTVEDLPSDYSAAEIHKVFEDPDGNEVASIKQKMMRLRKTMEVEGPDGETLATIKKDMITPFRERYTVERADGSELHVQGNILDHEYEFELDGRKVAQVSKKWFRVRDSYGVEVAQDQEVAVILAAAVAIDQIAHDIA